MVILLDTLEYSDAFEEKITRLPGSERRHHRTFLSVAFNAQDETTGQGTPSSPLREPLTGPPTPRCKDGFRDIRYKVNWGFDKYDRDIASESESSRSTELFMKPSSQPSQPPASPEKEDSEPRESLPSTDPTSFIRTGGRSSTSRSAFMMVSALTLAAPSLSSSTAVPTFPVSVNAESFHAVRRQWHQGLLIDTGAAMALTGTETLRQLVLLRHKLQQQLFHGHRRHSRTNRGTSKQSKPNQCEGHRAICKGQRATFQSAKGNRRKAQGAGDKSKGKERMAMGTGHKSKGKEHGHGHVHGHDETSQSNQTNHKTATQGNGQRPNGKKAKGHFRRADSKIQMPKGKRCKLQEGGGQGAKGRGRKFQGAQRHKSKKQRARGE